MQARRALLALTGAAMLLSACSSGTPHLMNLRKTGYGPDEFAILPPKSLQMPKDLTALPTPTPGGTNLTDPTPVADAVKALGGKPSNPNAQVPASDSALVKYADRDGVTPDIRSVLASEDLAWRKKHQGRLLERIFDVNTYYRAYQAFTLDAEQALAYWRARGVATPSAPPPGTKAQ